MLRIFAATVRYNPPETAKNPSFPPFLIQLAQLYTLFILPFSSAPPLAFDFLYTRKYDSNTRSSSTPLFKCTYIHSDTFLSYRFHLPSALSFVSPLEMYFTIRTFVDPQTPAFSHLSQFFYLRLRRGHD